MTHKNRNKSSVVLAIAMSPKYKPTTTELAQLQIFQKWEQTIT